MRIVLALDTADDIRMIGDRLQDAARQRGEDLDIVPAPAGAIPDVEWERADAVLVGPQTKVLLPELQSESNFNHVPVAEIPAADIAIADGERIMEQLMALVHNQDYHRDSGQGFNPR